MSEALGRCNALAINKLYNSSNNIIENSVILIIKNNLMSSLVDRYIQNGTIRYTSIKEEIPKNNILLKQMKPPMFPKFNISTL